MVSLAAPVAALPSPPASSVNSGLIANASRKRKQFESSDDELEPELSVHAPKKARVSFDPAIEVHVLEDYDEKGLDLIREEVRRAIDNHMAGDSTDYDQIKALFATRPSASDAPSTKLLNKYVVALIGSVNVLGRNCSGLVHAVLDCQWLTRDESFKRLYVTLLGSLTSAQGGYTSQVLQMLVKYFVELPSPAIRHSIDPPVTRPQLRERVHEALKRLLKLIPSASGVLSNILAASFPFAADSTKVHVFYTQNLLQITSYAPELKGAILALITERLVKIDVQIQVDMEDLDEDIEETLVEDVMNQNEETKITEEDDDDMSGEDSDDESVTSLDEPTDEKRLKKVRESVGKMDAMIDMLFEYYHQIFVKGTAVDSDATFELFISQFTNTLVPTYRSRHTQFLLFHYAQVSTKYIDRFTGACASMVFDSTRPEIMRLTACAYLASFIARGAHVPTTTVRDVFDVLGHQLDNFRVNNEAKCKGPDLRRYAIYYAMAQALIYIFCFRWRELVIDETGDLEDEEELLLEGRDLTWLPGIKENLMRNIYCKLNPLKICSPGIVGQFARIAHHLRFLYVFPLVETNKKLRLSKTVSSAVLYGGLQERETALSAKLGDDALQLDGYFPFDPYSLPRSKRWMEGDYKEWKSIPGMEPEAEDDSDTEVPGEESEGEEFEEGTATEMSG
ncbi:RNA polymerase I-specific transcription initiation factor RRN3 [Phyllosticta citricarpa]|uniref:RNA polymerase I-specific transcription initiation factor RRN3 n=2 Tax=Phyllosticta TaxID=121621 RepID=A0ABR1MCD7_9PEZI